LCHQSCRLISRLFIAALFFPGVACAGELTIEVRGLRDEAGFLRIAVYGAEEDFLNPARMLAGVMLNLRVIEKQYGTVTVTLGAVRPGRYAVSTYHDENGDGQLDTNVLGIPTEVHAFSRAAKGRFGPPSFADASFPVGDEPVRERLTIEY
jgi:uncharacterized protein (DUF2141 family)